MANLYIYSDPNTKWWDRSLPFEPGVSSPYEFGKVYRLRPGAPELRGCKFIPLELPDCDGVASVADLIEKGEALREWMKGPVAEGMGWGSIIVGSLFGHDKPVGAHEEVLPRLDKLGDAAVRLGVLDEESDTNNLSETGAIALLNKILRRARDVGTTPEAGSGEQPAAQAKEPPLPRLTVDLARKTATLDGVSHDVSSDLALRWVKVLADHAGDWISGSELERYDESLIGARTDRLRKFLPDAILRLIDSETGKGSRIRL
jgi:hypothetical protein